MIVPRGGAEPNAVLLRKVAARTSSWRFQVWGFGEAIALRGLLASARALNDRSIREFVRALLMSYAEGEVGTTYAEHVAPGRELIELYAQTGDEPLLRAARRLALLHAGLPRNVAGARLHRPDLSGWRHQIWVDCMDNEAPFLMRLGVLTGEQAYFDDGLDEILTYARLLQDETTGLFFHGYEDTCGRNGQWWARGNGWALMGLVAALQLLPVDHVAHRELSERLERLCGALARCQDEGGLWHTIVTEPSTYLESTLAAMVASAIPAACHDGVLRPGRYERMGSRAREAVLEVIGDDGTLHLVTDATPVAERAMYATRRFGTFPWGQGPLLLMLADTCV